MILELMAVLEEHLALRPDRHFGAVLVANMDDAQLGTTDRSGMAQPLLGIDGREAVCSRCRA